MPLAGEKLDELLTGYLDGQLSDDERKLVQAELAGSEVLRKRLDDLSAMSSQLKRLFEASRDGLAPPKGLASRAIAEAQRRAIEADLPPEHYLRLHQRATVPGELVAKKPLWAVRWKIGAAAAALAAAWFFALYLPGTFGPDDDSRATGPISTGGGGPAQDPIVPEIDASHQEPMVYVSEVDFSQQIIFLVDIELSASAAESDEIGRVLRAHGVLRDQPILADEKLEKAILDSRLTVKTEDSKSPAVIYFVRADMLTVARILDEMYGDLVGFPQLSFDMAIDNPASQLFQSIARSTGQRFAASQVFAAPISVSTAELKGSPFENIKKPELLVSSSQRQKGFSGDASALMLGDSSISNVLLFVRLPNPKQ